MNEYIERVIATVERRDNAKPAFIQCVKEVYRSLEAVIEEHPDGWKIYLAFKPSFLPSIHFGSIDPEVM